ncbi:sulfite exporter TauE/SafE family protein [Ktedonospora formicarum]|uniref:Probable membrane transporter protein n=1 Tax=Ktedonospora formicarum TaxID=2778364 RepID=A0A8J3MT98_9CHLR|nr:sulfite exporter TauE/SafE family protein [Ktedonospora formicarum]GHO44135.1 UPF0721 transmembrane protein [Ktedonospora formicarum]
MHMTWLDIVVLFVSAIIGGTLNAVAGGGSFFCFPALLFTGLPAIQANATNTLALWPGSLASVGAYRRELKHQQPAILIILIASSLLGSLIGALVLLGTKQDTFVQLVPFLLLLATLLFAVSPYFTARLRTRMLEHSAINIPTLILVAGAQFLISIYGGFFGGGIGILMLATLALMGMENIHEMNSVKTLLTVVINGSAMVLFIIRGAIFWPQALLMIVGTVLGGYGGAYYARKLDPKYVRIFVIGVGLLLTVYFFARTYLSW